MRTNDLEIMLVIAYVIASIFSIVLFVKIWIATNKISAIESKLKNSEESYKLYMLQGEKEKAYKYLVSYLSKYLIDMKKYGYSDSDFEDRTKQKIDEAAALMAKTGYAIPEHLSSGEKFLSFYKELC
jgi:hypothetical protein